MVCVRRRVAAAPIWLATSDSRQPLEPKARLAQTCRSVRVPCLHEQCVAGESHGIGCRRTARVNGSSLTLDISGCGQQCPMRILAGVRSRANLLRLLSAVGGCCLIVLGCADQEDSYGPLRGVRDGDTHSVYVRLFCGADYLDVIVNDIGWRAEELNGDERGWIPREWAAAARTVDGVSDMLMVELRMESNGSRLVATAQGRTVVYRPTTSEDPPNECA